MPPSTTRSTCTGILISRSTSPDLRIRCGCAIAQRDRHRMKPTPLHPHPGRNGSNLQCPGGVRASSCRMAGCATRTNYAGHAPAGAKVGPKLTFKLDHYPGADH